MENNIKIDLKATEKFVSEQEFSNYINSALKAFDTLEGRKGKGSEYLGWMNLPSKTSEELISDCEKVAKRWAGVELVVVIGIGGSYLGAKSALDALSHSFQTHLGRKTPQIVFAGQNVSEEYLAELIDLMSVKSVACIVISKSGTTTEPAVAFRIIKNFLEEKYGRRDAAIRIVAITDASKGALKVLADNEGYTTFVIPDDIGGRFSVLTPVGLVPLAVAGFDIRYLLKGAADMENICSERSPDNPAVIYAAIRNALYNNGKKVELLVTYNPKLQYVAEWWKQLFGESEGKEGKGIFPASVNFTSDLHSMGQYIQQGERIIFETVISVKKSNRSLLSNSDSQNLDGLNFISDKHLDVCNKMAELGTKIAHYDGGVPNIKIEIPSINEYNLGSLYYFFEKACGISAYMLGVNPFDQPGVEDYKINMFALLGKPGYEKREQELKGRF
ncbi:MAG: glucose-6-phosphate isomerase [Thiovulaceae bacterium]|nr:glucose-6-phosphate isomerase [Sulfurimonadaceae bacterium]